MVWSNISTFFDMASGRRILKHHHQAIQVPQHQLKLALFQFYFSAFARFHFIHSQWQAVVNTSRFHHPLPSPFLLSSCCSCCSSWLPVRVFRMRMRKVFIMNWKNAIHQQPYGGLFFTKHRDGWQPNTTTHSLCNALSKMFEGKWKSWERALLSMHIEYAHKFDQCSTTAPNKYLHWKLIHCEWNIFVGKTSGKFIFSFFLSWLLSAAQSLINVERKHFVQCRFFSDLAHALLAAGSISHSKCKRNWLKCSTPHLICTQSFTSFSPAINYA